MPIKLDHLNKLFQEQVKDAYSAENQSLSALRMLRDAATDEELRSALGDHLAQTDAHASRLDEICDMLHFSPGGHKCRAMQGLIDEASEVVNNDEADPSVRDAAIICAAQKIEHYEIALYGCLRAYADLLSHDRASGILESTLTEERQADQTLTEIAMRSVNAAAIAD
ncbi:MAG: ferritin-like domain-containing protein [Phycisphaeraceae bacterium]|nr:ferritin-like domain-containing protein [Phycisphaeraceae bacterium]